MNYCVIGAGVIGLAIARAILLTHRQSKVTVIDKERKIAQHASGRNSGVLHSGLYYTAGSLKSQLCAKGARAIKDYCSHFGLPIKKAGKIILPTSDEDISKIADLHDNARKAGVVTYIIERQEIARRMPAANPEAPCALFSPDTAVVDPLAVINQIAKDVDERGGRVCLGEQVLAVDAANHTVHTTKALHHYDILVNAAGAFADKIAHAMDVGKKWRLLPFRGRYYEVRSDAKFEVRGNLYPVPDPRTPFLGVHFTETTAGKIRVGPTAAPAFGREHYGLLKGIELREAPKMGFCLSRQYILNDQGMRSLMHRELMQWSRRGFHRSAKKLIPQLRLDDLRPAGVGIRPQLIDAQSGQFMMDFSVELGLDSIHILNAISPGLTCSLAFADHLVRENL